MINSFLLELIFIIISIQDFINFEYNLILGIVFFILYIIKYKYGYVLLIVMLLTPFLENNFIGNGDIPFILMLMFYHNKNWILTLFQLCIISLILQRNGKTPMITSIYICMILYNIL